LAINVHSYRAAITKADTADARAFRARGGADFTLFADGAYFPNTSRSNFPLFAKAAIPTGVAPPQFALAAHDKPVVAENRAWRYLYPAIAAAVALHFWLLLFFLQWPQLHRQLGTEDGLPDHLNVSVVSEADLQRLSSDPFRQESLPAPSPPPDMGDAPGNAPPVPPTPPQQQPVVKEASAAFSPTEPNTNQKRDTAFDPSGYIAMASEQFGSEIKQAFAVAEAQREQARRVARPAGGNVRALRPGASHDGKSDAWERAVIWALSATKPMGNGKWGSTEVFFVVSPSGKVEDLKLIRGSGDNWLDQGALMGVRQARIPAPPPGLSVGDRGFDVTYISLPDH